MKEELQKQLFDKYPKIFGDHTKSPQETCMCWGLEVRDEWYNIIDGALIAIAKPDRHLIKNVNEFLALGIKITI